MQLRPNWYQIGNKTRHIPKVSNFSVEKGYLCLQDSKYHLCNVDVYFVDENIMESGNPMELNFERLEMQKRKIPSDRAQRVYEKNGVICLVIICTPVVIVIKI